MLIRLRGKLICTFVDAYVINRFSHDEDHYTGYAANKKVSDQSVWMHRLICAFVVCIGINRFAHDMALTLFSFE